MSRLVTSAIIPPVAVLTIEHPPLNLLSDEVWAALDAAIAGAAAAPTVGAIVLIGGGPTFVAGADIKVFAGLRTAADAMARTGWIHALLQRIEDTAMPVIAAIHGHALGGGLELAMACHFRIATMDASLGQPEVRLGLIPGAGGSQRLPRLVGPVLALRLCTEGRPIGAAEAAQNGLVDHIVAGDLRSSALGYARAKAVQRTARRTRELTMPPELIDAGLRACADTRAALTAAGRRPQAPLAAVAAVEAALQRPFAEGALRERELFAECVVSNESLALRHLFFAEREAMKPPADVNPRDAVEIRSAAIVGAGTMGAGIAMAYANSGIRVLLKEVDRPSLDRGMAAIQKTYESAVAKGRINAYERDRRLGFITPTLGYDDFRGAEIVVEAVFEDLGVKTQTFREIAAATGDSCVLATNTSTLDVDAIAEASGRPSQVVGHHFFSPAHIMSLLEIVRGRHTASEVLATSLKLARHLGKTPVIVGNGFGFVANRMLGYYLREAHLLLEEGATVAQIDDAMTTFGLPVGPFAMEDLAGIDVGARIRQHRAASGQGWAEGPASPLPDRIFALGRYGQKTGAGWYRYEAGSRTRIPDPLIDELAAAAARERGTVRRPVSDELIVSRITAALANEGFRILDEGLAQRPGDIDVIYCHGFGFPRERGGPMFHAHTVGLPVILETMRRYRRELGDHWQPAPLLERLVAEKRDLYEPL